ncbi:MAG: phospholipase D-like domain-containing protein [Marmoricola sp.]
MSLLSAGSAAAAAAAAAPAAAPTSVTASAHASTMVNARRAVGAPPLRYTPGARAYFSYPNRSASAAMTIRDRVLKTAKSTWGGPKTRRNLVSPGNGTIRIATWSFNDWAIAKALVAARNRGVSVQVVAAKGANKESGPWRFLKKRLGSRLPNNASRQERVSFARSCGGSCRGKGGTAHSKYFLFDQVGRGKARGVVFNTSMNLTRFAYTGQWNQAQVVKNAAVHADFMSIFRQTRKGGSVRNPYHVKTIGAYQNIFFPLYNADASDDPVMQILNRTVCAGATSGGTNGRTKIRVIQYAMYGERGVWIAKKLRSLWNSGCDVKIIYSVSSRPVVSLLRNKSGRGAIPMRQSVIRNSSGDIVKYNHSKWMTVTGHWTPSTSAWITFTGSANWSTFAFTGDEQMQRISSRSQAQRYLATFEKTWKQRTSQVPPYGRVTTSGRLLPNAVTSDEDPLVAAAPDGDIPFGSGIYKYMTEN